VAQYKAGTIDFTRVTQLEQTLETQQDTLAQAQGEIVTGLVQVYKALGGGWQIRETGCDPRPPERPGPGPVTPESPENLVLATDSVRQPVSDPGTELTAPVFRLGVGGR
jgi:hypothetical protein